MTSPVTATSRDALHDAISNGRAAVVTDAIYRVVQKAHREGIKDMSMQEIKAALRADGLDVDCSSISGRVKELIKSKRMVRKWDQKRACSITGASIGPLSIPPIQDRIGL